MASWLRAVEGVCANGNTGSINFLSGAPKVGDIRYVFTAANTNAFGAATMQGWNQLVNAQIASGMIGLWWKPYVANEVSVQILYNSTCDFVLLACSVAAGSPTGTPVFATNSGTSTSVTAPSVTPNTASSLQLCFLSSQIATPAALTATLSTPSGMTGGTIFRPASASGTGVGQVGMVASLGLTGTSATGTKTSTASTSGTWRTATVAHPPGPVVGAGPKGQFGAFFGGGF